MKDMFKFYLKNINPPLPFTFPWFKNYLKAKWITNQSALSMVQNELQIYLKLSEWNIFWFLDRDSVIGAKVSNQFQGYYCIFMLLEFDFLNVDWKSYLSR